MLTPYLSRLQPRGTEPGAVRPRRRQRFEPPPATPIDGPLAAGVDAPSVVSSVFEATPAADEAAVEPTGIDAPVARAVVGSEPPSPIAVETEVESMRAARSEPRTHAPHRLSATEDSLPPADAPAPPVARHRMDGTDRPADRRPAAGELELAAEPVPAPELRRDAPALPLVPSDELPPGPRPGRRGRVADPAAAETGVVPPPRRHLQAEPAVVRAAAAALPPPPATAPSAPRIPAPADAVAALDRAPREGRPSPAHAPRSPEPMWAKSPLPRPAVPPAGARQRVPAERVEVPTELTVTIGRVEVKVPPAALAQPQRAAAPPRRHTPSLDDYLSARARGLKG
jgi:hypothetical protein